MADPIKTEVKDEPTDDVMLDDEDVYEDAGDLEFYDTNAATLSKLYLARVPKYMWQAWAKMAERLPNDDAEIEIGTLRTWKEPATGAADPSHMVDKLRMLLKPGVPEHQGLPQEYNVDILNGNVSNHFVFSEEDLPSFRARNKARADAANAGIPTALLRNRDRPAGQRLPYDRNRKFVPYYRKAIPSMSISSLGVWQG